MLQLKGSRAVWSKSLRHKCRNNTHLFQDCNRLIRNLHIGVLSFSFDKLANQSSNCWMHSDRTKLGLQICARCKIRFLRIGWSLAIEAASHLVCLGNFWFWTLGEGIWGWSLGKRIRRINKHNNLCMYIYIVSMCKSLSGCLASQNVETISKHITHIPKCLECAWLPGLERTSKKWLNTEHTTPAQHWPSAPAGGSSRTGALNLSARNSQPENSKRHQKNPKEK